MPRIPGTNNQQSAFLRAMRTHLDGPPPELWPSPAIMRKWLRHAGFRRALDSIRDVLTYQTDFALVSAANCAARRFLVAATATGATTAPTEAGAADKPNVPSTPTPEATRAFCQLLRLAQQRAESAASLKLKSPATFDLSGWSWQRQDELDEEQEEEGEEIDEEIDTDSV